MVLVLLAASLSARADGTALHNYAPDGTPAWADNPQYMECGLKCIYLQSVEKISIKSRHTLETLNRMKAITAETQDDKDRMDAIIPGMCDWAGKVIAGKPETVKECQMRWFSMQLPTLYQDRLAIRYNTSSAGQLENTQVPVVSANGAVTADPSQPTQQGRLGLFLNSVDSDYTPKNPIVTTMEQYKDIRDRAISNSYRDPRLRQITTLANDIQNATNVTREEFVMTREILKDPSDPKAGTYSIVLTGKDGRAQIDEKAYQRAVSNRGKILGLKGDEAARLKANLNEIAALQRRQLQDTKANAEHEGIYKSVRSSILGAARDGLQKFKIIGASAPKAPPAPVKGVKAATTALSRAATNPDGTSIENVAKGSGNGDDRDINVPATQPAGSRPYFTVGYSDNILGQEINAIEQDLAQKRGVTLDP